MNFLTHIANFLLSAASPNKRAYTTVIYPVKGKAVVVHDGLGVRHERPWYLLSESQKSQGDDQLLFASMFDSSVQDTLDGHIHESDVASNIMDIHDTAPCFNPASGLPMLDGCIDVMGNPSGTDFLSENWLSGCALDDFGGSFSDFDFC